MVEETDIDQVHEVNLLIIEGGPHHAEGQDLEEDLHLVGGLAHEGGPDPVGDLGMSLLLLLLPAYKYLAPLLSRTHFKAFLIHSFVMIWFF